jgi:hypothetical protein
VAEHRNPQDPAVARRPAGHGAKSKAVREAAVLALLSERSITAAAERCGVNESTLRKWLAEPEFKAEHAAARRAIFEVSINRIQALNAKAVDTLEALLDVADAPSVRLGAAKTIVEIGIHQHDADTIMRKLDEIEQWQQRQELMKPNLSPF